jgi:hypothetical protein
VASGDLFNGSAEQHHGSRRCRGRTAGGR